MTGIPGRNGRRRRVLNEEVLSASTSHMALRALRDEEVLPDVPRYSEAAGVEHHPQITDFIPRRYGSITLLGATGFATIGALFALHAFSRAIESPALRAPLELGAAGSLASWVSAAMLGFAAPVAWIIFFLRRHRLDDIRGRYRVWAWASLACLILSINSVTGFHRLLAAALGGLVGWTALPEGAVWWLIVAGPVLAWITVRAALDTRECRLACALLVSGVAAYLIGLTSSLGWSAPNVAAADLPIGASATVLGNWAIFLGLVIYARYVILDAQGLIPVRVPSERKGSTQDDAKSSGARDDSHRENDYARETEEETEWIDGTSPERDTYDGDDDRSGPRKISKLDRKRLRKLKDQHRAA